MKKVYLLMSVLFVFCYNLSSQVNCIVQMYNGSGNGLDQSRAICIDQRNNTYITGNSLGSGSDMDICTIKYWSSNLPYPAWIVRFNGNENNVDQGNAIVSDANSNVYVTGWAHMSSNDLLCGTIVYMTIKYNTNGVQQWVAEYNGGSANYALAIALDAQANVYVTGSSIGSSSSEDIATIKYNTNGVQQWVTRYNGPSNGSDVGRAITVDPSGNVYVTGNSYQTGSGSDYITIKYNSSGVQQWAARYNGPGNGDDTAFAILVSKLGNIVVTGCAKGTTTNLDYTTISYGSDGSLQWIKTYNGPGNGIDEAKAMISDNYDNLYITGYSQVSGTNYDFATVSYDYNGVLRWVQRYDGPASSDDRACGIAISHKPCGPGMNICLVYSIYVTGQSKNAAGRYDYVTIKYDVLGDTEWVSRYSPPSGDAIPSAITAANEIDYVYVTGTIDSNYATLIYYTSSSPDPTNVIKAGQHLSQNYPNPFNPSTIIKYSVPAEANVSLKIYDVTGKEVAVLVNEKLGAGVYEVNWNAENIPSGVYFYTLKSNGVNLETKRMLLIK